MSNISVDEGKCVDQNLGFIYMPCEKRNVIIKCEPCVKC